jgi:hypothetical protein
MKPMAWLLAGIIVVSFSWSAQGFDRTGVLGLSYTVGPSFILGGSDARDVSAVEPGVGTALQIGIMPHADFLFSYDYLDAELRTQAITFGGQWRFLPSGTIDPFVGAGLGFGKPYSGEDWSHFSLKILGGLEKPVIESVSLAATLAYQYVEGPNPFGSVHTLEPGARLIVYFGKLNPRR